MSCAENSAHISSWREFAKELIFLRVDYFVRNIKILPVRFTPWSEPLDCVMDNLRNGNTEIQRDSVSLKADNVHLNLVKTAIFLADA